MPDGIYVDGEFLTMEEWEAEVGEVRVTLISEQDMRSFYGVIRSFREIATIFEITEPLLNVPTERSVVDSTYNLANELEDWFADMWQFSLPVARVKVLDDEIQN